jgi:hypothetical protein
MTATTTSLLATAAALMTASVLATPAVASMSDYRWKKRPLVVFAGTGADERLSAQKNAVTANRGGFAERDMVVIWVVGDRVSTDLGPAPGLTAAALRSRYGVDAKSFRSLLIGKDGGVKISSANPITAGTLFATIDAMPMRRDEMRR